MQMRKQVTVIKESERATSAMTEKHRTILVRNNCFEALIHWSACTCKDHPIVWFHRRCPHQTMCLAVCVELLNCTGSARKK